MLSKIKIILVATIFLQSCQQEIAPVYAPEEASQTFVFAEDVEIQLVASEPMVEDPVFITFDEMGRLWVVEMRGYMPNVDQEGEDQPVGRIKVLLDMDEDGEMDSSVVFLDSLVLPRSVAIVEGGALVAEQIPLWYAEDLDGDLVADRKTLIDSTYGGKGMPEHSPNALWRGLDNWYYNAKSKTRYLRVGNEWKQEKTEFRGQWGMSHDDLGRLYYNYNWSQLHADLVPPNYLSRNQNHHPTAGIDHGLTIDRRIYPIRPNPAVNRGYIDGALDENGKLLEFTAACAPFVYRGAALPQFKGDVFVAEPAGNLIKRNVVDDKSAILSAVQAYADQEFMASTDERFRPVHFASGPDGCLYFADMYRGLIEHGPYMTPYLREQTLARGLDLPIHLGRIWRIQPKGFTPSKSLIGASTTAEQLVNLLDHEDGWYRDVAQRLLVERADSNAFALLQSKYEHATTELGKIHALYTMQGLGLITPEIALQGLEDPHDEVKIVALRLLEPFITKDSELEAEVLKFIVRQKKDERIQLQIALSSYMLQPRLRLPVLLDILVDFGAIDVFRDAIMSSLQDQELPFLLSFYDSSNENVPSNQILIESLATAIGKSKNPDQILLLLNLIDHHRDSLSTHEKSILTGLSLVPGSKSGVVMLTDIPPILSTERIFDKAMQARINKIKMLLAWPGYSPESLESSDQYVLTEEEQALFALGRQHYTTSCSGCHGPEGEGLNRFAPPLRESEWVLGDESRLALLVLHGIEGPIEVNGKTYGAPDILPVMPSHSTLDDRMIASILTYIRCEWGHNARPVQAGTVGKLRHHTQGRVQPWKVKDLNAHIEEKNGI